jgi:putative molybdopterin biosynthesis protein
MSRRYTPPGDPLQLLPVADTARVLSISKSSVYRLRERGELRGVRVGARLRFSMRELEEFIHRGREPSAAPRARGCGEQDLR